MLTTTRSSRGQVVLVDFVFPDQQGVKKRPALVLSSATYHRGRQEVILAAVTSNVRRVLPGDTALEDWREAGLLRSSVVTGILRTVKEAAITRRLGALTARDMRSVERSVRLALDL